MKTYAYTIGGNTGMKLKVLKIIVLDVFSQ